MTSMLTVYQPATMTEIQSTADLFAKSGMFTDARGMAQAFVKIMAGGAMGFDPFSSMTGIHIIKGKPSMGAGMIAAAIARHPGYDFDVIQHTDKVCTIKFLKYRDGKWIEAGTSEFTIADAANANLLSNQTWKSYPKNMLYARAMSNGAKWYCPGIFGGSVYVPEELGVEVDHDGNVIDAPTYEELPPEPTIIDNQPQPEPKPTGINREQAEHIVRYARDTYGLEDGELLNILKVSKLSELTSVPDALEAIDNKMGNDIDITASDNNTDDIVPPPHWSDDDANVDGITDFGKSMGLTTEQMFEAWKVSSLKEIATQEVATDMLLSYKSAMDAKNAKQPALDGMPPEPVANQWMEG